jgi:hypothetical protein
MIQRILFFVVATTLIGACAVDGAPDPPAEPVCITDAFGAEPDFVGLTETQADELAADLGLEVREVGRDGECFAVTDDFRQDRINLEFAGAEVIAAAIY